MYVLQTRDILEPNKFNTAQNKDPIEFSTITAKRNFPKLYPVQSVKKYVASLGKVNQIVANQKTFLPLTHLKVTLESV